ncbi:VOC family protein [Merismopedia glauca]|uniref:Glyoxalase n=1 Tax=Merismopedia glauca CCAP 1448/3 TaxID=1296344 RepID=A0A2T1C194_9CYAN|nr:VOC family protein [Merismopedia glauca]PSB02039.1 glyoxalase [Merismopedia glauca CCAP 1448/3]
MPIQKCLHTTLLVSDLAQAEYFYGETLGLEKAERNLNFPGVWYQVDGYQIHIIVHDGLPKRELISEKWGRNSHLAFSVTDIDALAEKLTTNGFICQKSASGRPALFTQDLDGNVIELAAASL